MKLRRGAGAGLISFAVTLAVIIGPASASAALPVGYDVQRLNSPNTTVGGDYGIALLGAGDLNGDGKQDIIAGTDEHGGSTGQIYDISGADGSTIRTVNVPAADIVGDAGTLPSFGSYIGKVADLGSCPGGTPGVTCPNATIGALDGVPDQLVTAINLDIPFTDPDTATAVTLVDAGRAYVIDGATGAVLKRLQMPVSDLNQQFDAPAPAKKPAFGRTILNPSSPYGTGTAAPSAGVQIGDMNGGGAPDIIVSASDYFETSATANPQSACALAVPAAQCLQAGRAYVFYGESIVGTSSATIEDTPDMTIKNPAAQPDDTTTPVNSNRESFGYSIEPVGDIGACNANPGQGLFCTNANSTGTPDGKADVAISSHRSDDFGMVDVGVVPLIDGSTGSVLYTYRHPEPQPASIFGFSNYNQPAIGDVGNSTAPDLYQAAMRQNNPYTGGGKGFVLNGAFKQSGSPNSISFATLTDPTPHPSEDFGTSSAGIGDVFGDARNEILVGAYGPHNPGTASDTINDVHIMDPIHETALQNIDAPDQQPGLGFGTALAPLGDLNGDGFLDFAVGAGLYDLTTTSGTCAASCADAGRIYIFRSNNTPTATPPSPGPSPVPPTVTVQSGRRVEVDASKARITKGRTFRLLGRIDQFVDGTACTAGQPVTIQRRKPGTLNYSKIGTATTTSGGTLSKKIKPTKTFVYRVRLAATSTCGGDISNPVKVVVTPQKKR